MKKSLFRRTRFQANEPTVSSSEQKEISDVLPPTSFDPVAMSKLLRQLGTNLWRMKQKMIEPGTGETKEEMRRVYRHVEASWDALAEQGIEIRDFTQMKFHPGLAIRVIAFQPLSGLDTETIIETINPGIYYQNQCIQMGEVIVGTPVTDGNTSQEIAGGQIDE